MPDASRPLEQRRAKHLAAIERSLTQADESARVGDFIDALGWLAVVEAAGDDLSDQHRSKRELWQVAARDARAARQFATSAP